jgi:hypothetical protein
MDFREDTRNTLMPLLFDVVTGLTVYVIISRSVLLVTNNIERTFETNKRKIPYQDEEDEYRKRVREKCRNKNTRKMHETRTSEENIRHENR